MWLLVAFSGWLIQSLLILTLTSRFTAGWYWLYLMTLFSHLVVMLALIAESNRLYARLALATSARNRERDARLMSMDAWRPPSPMRSGSRSPPSASMRGPA